MKTVSGLRVNNGVVIVIGMVPEPELILRTDCANCAAYFKQVVRVMVAGNGQAGCAFTEKPLGAEQRTLLESLQVHLDKRRPLDRIVQARNGRFPVSPTVI